MRETRGGARAASWLAVLASVGIVAGLMEPVQQRIVLFQQPDLLLAGLLYASYVTWIALVVASVLRARDGATATATTRPATAPARGGRRSLTPARQPRPVDTRQASAVQPIAR